MTRRAKYLVAGLALAVLLLLGAGVTFAYSQMGSTTSGNGMGSMMDDSQGPTMMSDQGMSGGQTDGNGMMGDQKGSMMGGQGMSGGQMMGSFDESKPFDLQFIDQMTMHHEGAIMSSQMMIADSKRPELRQLAEDIQKSQSEQIDQMQAWRKQWYPDAGQTSEMMGNGQMKGMMGGSMQNMMGGDQTDAMFLRIMIPHHQMAIDMSEQALNGKVEHPELADLAQKIKDEQSAQIEQMQGYLDEIDAATGS